MNAATKQYNWASFLKFYSDQNEGRLTRLGVFEHQSDIFNDYWLEAGLPFIGIDIDSHVETPTIEIMLGGFSHTVKDVRELKAHFSFEGDEDGLDINGSDGNTTILRFE